MPETNAEGVGIAIVPESAQGAWPPPTTGWYTLEPDAIGDPGPDYKKQARSPFTITRQLRRPFIAGLDASLSLELDATRDHIEFFGPGMFKSDWKNSGNTDTALYHTTAATATGFTVAALGALPDGTLVVARGFANEENNGLFVVAGAGATEITVVGGLTAEPTPPANAIVEVAGFQFADGDFKIDTNGDFITTTKDLTTLDLFAHQFVVLGSADEVDLPHHFATAEYYGSQEVLVVTTNKITLRRRSWEFTAQDTGVGKTIRLFYTKWIRNVARSHDDENLVSYAIEATYPGLADGPADAHEYMLGYMLNETTFNIPAEGKISLSLSFIGMTARDPSTTRATGPSSAYDPVTGLAISTSSDMLRLSVDNVDESGLMTDFGDMKIMLKNNITPEKAIGTLGNRFTPLGVFEATITGKAFFTTPDIVTAVHDNRILRFAGGGRNDDFGIILDIPSTGEMKSKKSIEHNKTVTIDSETAGFMDASSRFTAAMSYFAFLPRTAPGLET